LREPKRASKSIRKKSTQNRKRKGRSWKPHVVEKKKSNAGRKRNAWRLNAVRSRSVKTQSAACAMRRAGRNGRRNAKRRTKCAIVLTPSAPSVKGRSRSARGSSNKTGSRSVPHPSLKQRRIAGVVEATKRRNQRQRLGAEVAILLQEAAALRGLPLKRRREAGAEGVTAETMRLPKGVLAAPLVVMPRRRVRVVPGDGQPSALQALTTLVAPGVGQTALLLLLPMLAVEGEMKVDGDSRVVVGQQRRQGNPRCLKPLLVSRHPKLRKNHQLQKKQKMMDGPLQSTQSAVEPSSLAAEQEVQLEETIIGVVEEEVEHRRPETLLPRAAAAARKAAGERQEAHVEVEAASQTNVRRHLGRKIEAEMRYLEICHTHLFLLI